MGDGRKPITGEEEGVRRPLIDSDGRLDPNRRSDRLRTVLGMYKIEVVDFCQEVRLQMAGILDPADRKTRKRMKSDKRRARGEKWSALATVGTQLRVVCNNRDLSVESNLIRCDFLRPCWLCRSGSVAAWLTRSLTYFFPHFHLLAIVTAFHLSRSITGWNQVFQCAAQSRVT